MSDQPTFHAGQRRILRCAKRFNTVPCGRRFGKTTMGLAIAAAGWRLIRVTGVQIHLGYALWWVMAAMPGADAVGAFSEVIDWNLDKVRAARRARRRNTTVFMTLAERKGGATT